MGGAGTPKIYPTPYLILGINVSKYQKNGFTPSKDKLRKPLCPQTRRQRHNIIRPQIFCGRMKTISSNINIFNQKFYQKANRHT